jgi:hypothetical protein
LVTRAKDDACRDDQVLLETNVTKAAYEKESLDHHWRVFCGGLSNSWNSVRRLSGNFYGLDASNGEKLCDQVLGSGGGIGGGIITYSVNGEQRVAVADGFTMVAWPFKPGVAKVIVLGLDNATTTQ